MELPSLVWAADGRTVNRSVPEFLDALTTKSDFSFMLVHGGTLRTGVSAGELQDAVSDLYERLVMEAADSPEMKTEAESALLRGAWRRIAAQAQLRSKPDYQEDLAFLGLAKGKQRTFQFDAAIHPRFAVDARLAPRAVFQRVVLTRQSSVCTAAFMLNAWSTRTTCPKRNAPPWSMPATTNSAGRSIANPSTSWVNSAAS